MDPYTSFYNLNKEIVRLFENGLLTPDQARQMVIAALNLTGLTTLAAVLLAPVANA